MLQTEFTQRTQIWVTAELFEELHKQYMSSTLDKDAWCKQYSLGMTEKGLAVYKY